MQNELKLSYLNNRTLQNEMNLAIAWMVTTEPDILERDLKKAGTVKSMHYHDDIRWSMDALEYLEKGGFTTTVRYASGTYSCEIMHRKHDIHAGTSSLVSKVDAIFKTLYLVSVDLKEKKLTLV